MNDKELDEEKIKEVNDKLDELKITQFELDDEDKKKTQELFHYVLTHIIDEYNKLNSFLPSESPEGSIDSPIKT